MMGTARRSTAQHGAAWRSMAQHGAARRCTALHGAARHSTALHGAARHCTALHCTAHHGTARHGVSMLAHPARTARRVVVAFVGVCPLLECLMARGFLFVYFFVMAPLSRTPFLGRQRGFFCHRVVVA